MKKEKFTDAADAIVYCGVECSGEWLREMDSDSSSLRIKRNEVKSVNWRYGLLAPSPILQIVFGVTLAAIGWFPVGMFVKWIRGGGAFPVALVYLIPIPAIGLWMALSAFRRGYFLEVDLDSGRKRLVFKGRTEVKEVQGFVEAIRERWELGCS
jgi:hypothetical protein